MPRNCYKNSDGIIFVCDITDRNSFNDIISYIEEANDYLYNYKGIICSNKCDLEEKRQITKEEIVSFGLSQNIEAFEVSAKTGKNIDEVFQKLIELIIRKKQKIQRFLNIWKVKNYYII